jgi:hypothetical protein
MANIPDSWQGGAGAGFRGSTAHSSAVVLAGGGVCLVGNQYHLEVGDQNFYKYTGKMNFSLRWTTS